MSTADVLDEVRQTVVELLRDGDRFVTVTHEHPDGDAIGSLVAATRALQSLGKDVVAMVAPGDLPLSREYAGMATIDLAYDPPADLAERTAVFLDCGNLDRMAVDVLGPEPVGSSTSIITTTTRASVTSTSSTPPPRAPSRSSGTCSGGSTWRSTSTRPRPSTSVW